MPEGTRARDVVCTISKSHLVVKLKGQDAIIDADFPCDARNGKEIWEKVRADECYWSLQPGTEGRAPQVAVYLEKERECWWKSAVHGAEEIDTTKVDSTRQVYDYDDETQGAIPNPKPNPNPNPSPSPSPPPNPKPKPNPNPDPHARRHPQDHVRPGPEAKEPADV